MRSKNYTKLGITGILLLLGSIPSIAACTADTVGGSTFTCSGTDTTPQIITTDNAAVNVAAGYMNTNTLPAILISATGALSYTDTNASIINSSNGMGLNILQNGGGSGPGSITITSNGSITGQESGVETYNSGIGDTVITVTGLVEATSTGIVAENNNLNSTGKLIINANEIKSEVAIDARNHNQGDTEITVTADNIVGGISSTNVGVGSNTTIIAKNISTLGEGIMATQSYGDLKITANDITAGGSGVIVSANGDGTNGGGVHITSTGTVKAASGVGFSVTNSNEMGGVTIDANNISAVGEGIWVLNLGADTIINTTGNIEAEYTAIHIVQTHSGLNTVGNIEINEKSGSITGGTNGIDVTNYGLGSITIKVDGDVVGTAGDGILIAQNVNGVHTAENITITQTAGTITGGINGINALNDGTGRTTITVAGVVTGGTGAGINTSDSGMTSPPIDHFATVTLNSGAVVSSTSGVAITNDEGDSLTTVNDGAAIQGKVILGDGNDNLVINGTADISGATLLDGGDTANSVDLLGSTTYTNKLTFNGTTQSIAGSTMVDWQTVTLDKSNVTFINDATLVTGVGTNSDGSLQGLVLTNASTLTSPIALAVTGDVNIDSTSTLSHALGGSITGDVTNAGMIYWQNLGQH